MVVAARVAERYPHDERWPLGAVGYAGYPLKDADGRPIGVLAILSTTAARRRTR